MNTSKLSIVDMVRTIIRFEPTTDGRLIDRDTQLLFPLQVPLTAFVDGLGAEAVNIGYVSRFGLSLTGDSVLASLCVEREHIGALVNVELVPQCSFDDVHTIDRVRDGLRYFTKATLRCVYLGTTWPWAERS